MYLPIYAMKLSAVLFALLLAGCTSLSGKRVYQDDTGALRGYDPVAYFTEHRALKGSPKIHTVYAGAHWQFSSEVNKSKFLAAPQQYLPQYGGYCAYAMNYDLVVSSDPRAFTIKEGKLYLNYSFNVRKKWLKNSDEYIQSADQYWQKKISTVATKTF